MTHLQKTIGASHLRNALLYLTGKLKSARNAESSALNWARYAVDVLSSEEDALRWKKIQAAPKQRLPEHQNQWDLFQ